MKGLLISLVLCIVPCLANGQWISLGGGYPEILALGSHDTTLFQGLNQPLQIEPILERFIRTGSAPYWKWGDASGGINRTYGNITSFASLGRYFFASMTYNNTDGTAWISSDNGASWVPTAAGFICIDGGYAFCSSNGIYRSRDSGKVNTWTKLTDRGQRCMVAFGPVLVAESYGPLSRSTDTGNTWTSITCPETDLKSFTPINGLLYAIGQHLLSSPDSGLTWSIVSTPFTPQTLCTDGTHLFVGANDGLYIEDSGGTWRETGLAKTNVNIMCVFDSLLWAESWVPGRFNQPYYTLYYRPLSEIVKPAHGAVQSVAATTESISLYPNPATGVVTIASSAAIEELEVENILGTTVLSRALPHSPSATLDLSALPAGTYTVKITTEYGVRVRRVIKE